MNADLRDPVDGPGAHGAAVFEAVLRGIRADRDGRAPDPADEALITAHNMACRREAARAAARRGPAPAWGDDGSEPDYESIAETRRSRGRAGPETDDAAADRYERDTLNL